MGAGDTGARNFLQATLDAVLRRKPSAAAPGDCGSFRQLFSKSPDAMALLEGPLLSETNPAWDNLFGYPEAEFPGKSLDQFLPELSEHGTIPLLETPGLKRDGSRLRLEVSGYPFPWQ